AKSFPSIHFTKLAVRRFPMNQNEAADLSPMNEAGEAVWSAAFWLIRGINEARILARERRYDRQRTEIRFANLLHHPDFGDGSRRLPSPGPAARPSLPHRPRLRRPLGNATNERRSRGFHFL